MDLWPTSPSVPALMAAAVLVALAIDRALGEPPARLHPVVGMGLFLSAVGPWASRSAGHAARPMREFVLGACLWCLGAAVVVVLALGLVWCLQGLPPAVQALALGLWLKPLMAWRMLRDEVLAVEGALARSLDDGRARVAWLVSRDVSQLSPTEVREAAVSTLAENLNDSVMAPLFWFALFGLPGAALYRFANTADAMWGYRGERHGRDWTWTGRWAARVDDVLSWVPARITALLLLVLSRGRRWQALWANARLTPSPNGGWPMGALALGLGIRLGKPGVYALNPEGRAPAAADTALALRRCGQVVATIGMLAVLVLLAAWRGLA